MGTILATGAIQCLDGAGFTLTALDSYYQYRNGGSPVPYNVACQDVWEEAVEEALRLELGTLEGNDRLDRRLDSQKLGPDIPWVLIGGPPCQAYSLVGGARTAPRPGIKWKRITATSSTGNCVSEALIRECRPDGLLIAVVEQVDTKISHYRPKRLIVTPMRKMPTGLPDKSALHQFQMG